MAGFSARVGAGAGVLWILLAGCGPAAPPAPVETVTAGGPRPEIYAEATLDADLAYYTDDQRRMLALLIEASTIMDDLFWQQAFGDGHATWLDSLPDERQRRFAEQNYGPWDRLDSNRPFVDGFGSKPPGANFYPVDMNREEFDAAFLRGKADGYSLVRRDPEGRLVLVPYQLAYASELAAAADLLRQAAAFAESADFATYLKLRANALVSDDYSLSDLFWMDVRDNEIDIIIGPIETYEDALYGYRAAYESMVLLKDLDWSARLAKYTDMLPDLQAGLPVPEPYRQEVPGGDAELNAYDVVFYAGHANAGPKAVAVNLPNDEDVQLQKGTRRLQLKNITRAKFDNILVPLATELVDASQLDNVSFDAFFAYTMFHEVAHGLGIKNTLTGKGTVRDALRELASPVEEGKADVLSLYMIERLHAAGELDDTDIMDFYVTALASTLRSIRFGGTDAHGRANRVRFNYFLDNGAFTRDPDSGRYRVDRARMQEAVAAYSARLLTLQGDGDYEAAAGMLQDEGDIGPRLEADLDRLADADIPVDVVFIQGSDVLGLDALQP